MATQTRSANTKRTARVQQFIRRQIGSTTRQVKTTDLITSCVQIILFTLVFFLVVAIIDAWVWPLSTTWRLLALVVWIAGTVYLAATRLVPLLIRRVNPLFAARMIEQAKPEFKNSLVNCLELEKSADGIPRPILDAVSYQAATHLDSVKDQQLVDRSGLIRVGFLLVAVVAAFVAYGLFSPKNPLQSIGRILAPFADLAKPASVRISEIEPGDADVFFGERLDVTARIRGLKSDHTAHLVYSTDDGGQMDVSIPMKPSELDPNVFSARLATGPAGIESSLHYSVIAGDGTSPRYRVSVRPAPVISVNRIEVVPPEYTRLPERTIEGQGEIQGIEGSRVTVHALANTAIDVAYIELLRKNTSPRSTDEYQVIRTVEMQSDDRTAIGSFVLALNSSRSDSRYTHYQVRFKSEGGVRDRKPNVYPIRTIADLAPEIKFLQPVQTELSVPVNHPLTLQVQASDLDFELSEIALVLDHVATDVLDQRIVMADAQSMANTPSQPGRPVVAKHTITPEAFSWKPGDEVLLFATAADNRISPFSGQPDPNISRTPNIKLKITGPSERSEPPSEQPTEDSADPADSNSEEAASDSQSDNPDQRSDSQNDNNNDDSARSGDQADERTAPSSTDENRDDSDAESQMQPDDATSDANNPESSNDAGDSDPSSQSGSEDTGAGEDSGSADDSDSSQGNSGDESQSDSGDESGDGNMGANQPGDASPESGASQTSEANQSGSAENANPSEASQAGNNNQGNSSNQNPNGGDTGSPGESGGQPGSSGDNGTNPQAAQDASLKDGQVESLPEDASDGEKFEQLEKLLSQNESPDDGNSSDASSDPSDPSGSSDSSSQPSNDNNSGSNSDNGDNSERGDNAEGSSNASEPGEGSDNNRNDASSDSNMDRNAESGSSNQSNGSDQQSNDGNGDASAESNQSGYRPGQSEGDSGNSSPSSSGEPSDSGSEKSGNAQSGDSQSGNSQSGNSQSGDSQSGNSESDNSQSANSQSGNSESGNAQSGSSGSQDSSSDEPSAGNPSNAAGESEGSIGGDESQDGDNANSDGGSDSQSGNSNDASGDSDSGTGNEASPDSQENSSQGSGQNSSSTGNSGSQSDSGSRAEGESQGGSGDRQQSGSGSPGQSNSDSSSENAPTGNTPSSGSASSSGPNSQSGAGSVTSDMQLGTDDPDLEHARKATDLILKRLKDQETNPDPELLEKMNWTQEDLKRFLQRWEEMKRRAMQGDQQAKREYENALRSLGLAPAARRRDLQAKRDTMHGLSEDGAVNRPPPEVMEKFNAFLKSRNRVRDRD